jgi:hypothetical protein
VLPSEFPYIEIILAVVPPFALPGRKPVNLRLDLGRPLLWILPDGSKPLVPPFKEKFLQCRLTPKTPGFDVEPLTTRVRSSINSFNSDSLLGMAGDTFFKGIGTYSTSSSSHASGISVHALTLSTKAGFSRCNPERYRNGTLASQLLVIRKTPHHSFSQQCRLRKWCEGEENVFKYPLPHRPGSVTVRPHRSTSVVTVTGSVKVYVLIILMRKEIVQNLIS